MSVQDLREDLRRECRALAGSLILGGFDGLTLPDETAARIAAGELTGVILFKRNIDSLDQVVALIDDIQAARPEGAAPLLVAVDQEGGPVARLRGLLTDLPPMRQVGRLADPRLCASLGELVGLELGALGFNLDFAPVFDVDSNPDNPVIGPRAFAATPEAVSQRAGAFALGLLVTGVIPCAKHFPGHGDTDKDSHVALPSVNHDRARLDRVELAPFRSAIRAELPMIMSAHVLVPALDAWRPATLSRAILTGLLREELGFRGVIVSDDLEMGAIVGHWGFAEAVELGAAAGLDLFLICHSAERQRLAVDVLAARLAAGGPEAERLRQASARVLTLRAKALVSTPGDEPHYRDLIRCAEHLALAQRVADPTPTEAGGDGAQ